MAWTDLYTAPEKNLWQGRADAPADSYFFQTISLLNLNHDVLTPTSKLSFGLIGFCCDEGILRNGGRTGAFEGPFAIRKMLGRLPVQRKDFHCYDAGNIHCIDSDLEAAQDALGQAVYRLLDAGMIPIVMGGGHELAWGNYQGIAKKYPTTRLGIANFDAHFDMRPLLPNQHGSSGTPFLQMALAHPSNHRPFIYHCMGIQHTGNTQQLFETAKKYHTDILLADDFHLGPFEKCVTFVNHIINQHDQLYVSLCLDVFAAPFAPGVSAPQVFGLTPWQIIPFVRQLAACGKVISYDIAELSPAFDIDDRTAKLAAHFIYEIIHHHAELGNHHGNNRAT